MSGLGQCLLVLGVASLALGCSSTAGPVPDGTRELEVAVPDTGRVYVQLAEPALVTPSNPRESNDWDLAFENYDVFTNSGPSGAGRGAAFGQLDLSTLQDDTTPEVPFLAPDKAGGAFLDWY